MEKRTHKSSGFTLIELLVAISIVAILATIGFTLFQNAQRTARDTKRRADIDAIATAMETHYDANNGTYSDYNVDPTASPTPAALVNAWFAGGAKPEDPLGSAFGSYKVTMGTGNSSFAVCGKLEDQTAGNYCDINGTISAKGAGGCTVGGTGTPTPLPVAFFCRKNQQEFNPQ